MTELIRYNEGLLEVADNKLKGYIDSMDGLEDAPHVSARIPGRKVKELFVK